MQCPQCRHRNRDQAKFCEECGFSLADIDGTASLSGSIDGERKQATVLFSDLSGYTAMTEKLDPEEVKEIMGQIFSEASEIVDKYGGKIEQFIGDEIMVLFGVPTVNEDDPVRAVKVALEIHGRVEALNPQFEDRIGKLLRMHSGLDTGLVITGDRYIGKSRFGITGDTVNLAKRLTDLAGKGEVLVSKNTWDRVQGHFLFQQMPPIQVKGKSDPVPVFKLLSSREHPLSQSRTRGVRADMIGRDKEMALLEEAIRQLIEGKGSTVSICGEAGTGKSRLIRELKKRVDIGKIQWLEGHAYGYTQNMPYFPLINLLTNAFGIEEGDSLEGIRTKVETGVAFLLGQENPYTLFIGSLFSLSYPEIDNVSPEYWKDKLGESIDRLLSAVVERMPTVLCFEDLHWADPSFIGLLERLFGRTGLKAVFICTHRSHFTLFGSDFPDDLPEQHKKIDLKNLTTLQSQEMLKSLLDTENIPQELYRLIEQKTEGNPFYLEEMINSLIESDNLVSDNGKWQLNFPVTEADIPASIHGLLTARVDRLEKHLKRILQEASVIGRVFLYNVLEKITDIGSNVDEYLEGLEGLDLIRTQSMEPELEYIFKHALIQEVVYKGLLIKERQIIHEKIGNVIEEIFKDRLPEFYDALAFHFGKGDSYVKALYYLIKSGKKSLNRYSVKEADQYFKNAFDLLSSRENMSEDEKTLLIDILNNWGYVYYYLGNIKEFIDLFNAYKKMAESLEDKARPGMLYAWFGIALFMAGKTKDSYENLRKALELGEQSVDQKVIGYACTWLPWTCAELGRFDEGIAYGERAQKISESFLSDQYLFFKSLGGLCYIYFLKGDTKKLFENADRLLSYGEETANSRSKVFGHFLKAFGYTLIGEMEASLRSGKNADEVALDPFYSQFGKCTLGMTYFLKGQLDKSEEVLRPTLAFCEKRAIGQLVIFAKLFLSPILIATGKMDQGYKMLKAIQESAITNQRRVWYAQSEYIMGKVFSEIAFGPKPSLTVIIKNIGFLFKNLPFAGNKAEEHFNRAIDIFQELGAKGFLAMSYFDLGILYKNRRKIDQARKCFSDAMLIFKEIGAEIYFKKAYSVLEEIE